MREEELFARCWELGAGKDGGGMSDDGAVGCFEEGLGGGGMARCWEFLAGKEGGGIVLWVSGSDGVAFDESRLNSGTAIEGAAGVAWGVFWLSSSLSSWILSLTVSFSSFSTTVSSPLSCLSQLFSLSWSCSSVAFI